MLLENYLFDLFPNLRKPKYREASPASERYNCVSLAVHTKRRVWWPNEHGYWPPGCRRTEEVDSFVSAFQKSNGFARCGNGTFEPGVEKIAIFSMNDEVQHVALQPTNRGGLWHSKLGDGHDILHELEALEGGDYGDVACFVSRQVKNTPKGKRARS